MFCHRAKPMLLATTMIAGAALAAPVLAQGPGAPGVPDEAAIVVTGTRIPRPNLSSTVPITSVGPQELVDSGTVSLGDKLNDLPSLRNTWSQQNSIRSPGAAALNLLDLRGLSINRTLVLVNGRRHVSATEGSFSVDVNTIPSDLVERVDIVTGGSSAIYGSDAIAGVVNFVLRRNYDGLKLRAQSGISSRGDRSTQFLSILGGQNFAGGRGNLTLAGEYSNADALYLLDRPQQSGAYAGRAQFQLTDNPAGEPNNTDGIPDRTYFATGIKSMLPTLGGSYVPYAGSNTVACINALGCRANGVPRVFRFQPNGTLVEADYGQADYRPLGSGNQLGGDGLTNRQYGQFAPGNERYSLNLLGHFDVSDAFKPYVEAKYVRVDYVQESLPTSQLGGANTGTAAAIAAFSSNSTGVPIAFENVFLNPQAATLIRSLQPAGSAGFRLQRTNLDLGSRGETGRRETWRVVAGVKGVFNGDWHYDLSFNYGRFDDHMVSRNNRIEQRFRLAVDAVANPAVNGVAGVAAGAPVCRSRLPGVVTPTPSNPANAAALAADIAACVPLNLFGEGAPSAAARSYINVDTQFSGRQTQSVASGYINGDLSQLFELPGGPVGFAVGAEWRRERGSSTYGADVAAGRTFLNAFPAFNPASPFEVKEAFGEVRLPLVKSRPLFDELTIDAAARVADYRGSTGTVLAWNSGLTWAPLRDIRLRANYATAVRAPDQSELYGAQSQGFFLLNDPCDVNFVNRGPNRAANCAAAGIPANFVNSAARSTPTSVIGGGNPFLKAERSRSLTLGAVLQPRFVPGLSVAADYYRVRVQDVISAPTAQQILDNCYDAASLDNNYCPLVNRVAGTFFFRNPDGVLVGGVNYAARISRGVDFEADYQRGLGGLGRLNLRLLGTYALQRDDFPFVTNPAMPDQLLFEVGDPELQLNWNASLKHGRVTLGYAGRYFSSQAVSSVGLSPSGGGIEDIRSVGGLPPLNADFSDPAWIPSMVYHDFRLSLEVTKRFTLYGGIDNAFDRLPPQGILGNGSYYPADGMFDAIGRFFYAGVTARF